MLQFHVSLLVAGVSVRVPGWSGGRDIREDSNLAVPQRVGGSSQRMETGARVCEPLQKYIRELDHRVDIVIESLLQKIVGWKKMHLII